MSKPAACVPCSSAAAACRQALSNRARRDAPPPWRPAAAEALPPACSPGASLLRRSP